MKVSIVSRSFFGLLLSSSIYSLCEVSDKYSGGMTNELNITPLLRKLGQNIAINLGSDHIKNIFCFKNIQESLKGKRHPDILNHDLEKLFKNSGVIAIGYLIKLIEIDWKEDAVNALGTDKKALKKELNKISTFLKEQQEILRKHPDSISIENIDIDDNEKYLEKLSTFLFSVNESLPKATIEKLTDFYTNNYARCFNLAFLEALKDEQNSRGFKAFQIRYMTESKNVLQHNHSILLEINAKLSILNEGAGQSLIDKSSLEILFNIQNEELTGFFNRVFDDFKGFISYEFDSLNAKFDRLERTIEKALLSDDNADLIRQLQQKNEELKQLKANNDFESFQVINALTQEIAVIRQKLEHSEEMRLVSEYDKSELEERVRQFEGSNGITENILAALEAEDYDLAETLLNLDTASNYFELGKVKKLKFQYNDALSLYLLAIEMGNTDKDLLHEIAIMHFELQNYEESLTFMLKFINESGNDKQLGNYLHFVGSIYAGKEDYDNAIVYYEKSLVFLNQYFTENSNPYFAINYHDLGAAYRGKGEYTIAIEYFTKFLSIYYLNDIEGIKQYTILRNYAFACGSIADLYCDIEMYEESIKYFKMAIQDLESYGDFFLYVIAHDYSKLGHVYLKIKDYDNAIENFEKCLSSWHQNLKKENYIHDEDIINTYHLLGIAYSNTQNFDNALYNYEKALFLDKDCNGDNTARKGSIYRNMGDLYKHEKKHKKSLKYYAKALSIYREHYPADSPIIRNLLNTLIFS